MCFTELSVFICTHPEQLRTNAQKSRVDGSFGWWYAIPQYLNNYYLGSKRRVSSNLANKVALSNCALE